VLPFPLPAGAPAANFEGVVLDPTRVPVAGAGVTATVSGRMYSVTARTSADGRFVLLLEPGHYTLTVESPGFRMDQRHIDVSAGGASNIEIVLQLGEFRQTVVVSEPSPSDHAVSAAMRVPTPLLNVPQGITVVGGSQIRDLSMQNMADVVRYVPGITMAQGEGHRDAPVIRGNVTTADFYLNGVRDDVQYLRDLYDVERVEAVKGANALTFGRGGGGGVINRVSKEANFAPIREAAIQGGTFGNKRVTTDLGYNFGDRVALRINGVYENSSSFRHDVSLERYGITPTATIRLGSHTHARLKYEYFHDGRTVDRGIPAYQGRPSSANRSTFFGDPANSNARVDVNIGSAVIEHQAGLWNLRNTTQVGDYDKFYQNIFPGAVSPGEILVSLSGYNNATARRNVFNQSDATASFSTGGLRHTLLIGADFGRQPTANFRNTAYFNANQTSIMAPFFSPSVRTSPVFRQSASDADNEPDARLAGTFVQNQIELNSHVQLVAGVRYDYFDLEVLDKRTAQRFARTDNLLSPRLGVVIKPVQQLSLYGSYGVTYLPSSGDQFASLSASSQTLKPEKFNNYEFGVKWDVTRRFRFTSALYRLDRLNTTARDPNNPGRIVQTGSQRTNGFELSVDGGITRRWTVMGGFAAQDAYISSATTAAPAGAKVALVPRRSLSFWNNYRLLPRLSLGLGIINQSEMFAGIDNSVALPSFTRADAAAFYSLTEKVRLQANVENLFNTNYYPTAHSNNNILPGSPLALRMGLLVRF
jgi:catecholate siderophore receptor